MDVLNLLEARELPGRNTIEDVDFADLKRGECGFVARHGLFDDCLRSAGSTAGIARREDNLVGRICGNRIGTSLD